MIAFNDEAIHGTIRRFPHMNESDIFHASDFLQDSSDIVYNELLSRGAFGVVYRATMNDNEYAVKVEDFHDSDVEQTNLLVELTILSKLSSDRLVKFVGAGIQYPTNDRSLPKLLFITELCHHGDLRYVIKLDLSWSLKIRIALDIAQGLSFLHSHGIIHRDIKTTNILVDGDWRAKICDFSFCVHKTSVSKGEYSFGTNEFMSPEIALALDFSLPADVFSYGILLYEMATERAPCADFMNRKPQDMFALNQEEVKLFILKNCPYELEALALGCTDISPDNRPHIDDCCAVLQDLLTGCTGSLQRNITLPIDSAISTPSVLSLCDNLSLSREGNVQYPKSDKLSTSSPISTTRLSWSSHIDSSLDFVNRIASLEVQVQQLRADNKRLSRDLHALAMTSLNRDSNKSSTSSNSDSVVEKQRSYSCTDSLRTSSNNATMTLPQKHEQQHEQQQQEQHPLSVLEQVEYLQRALDSLKLQLSDNSCSNPISLSSSVVPSPVASPAVSPVASSVVSPTASVATVASSVASIASSRAPTTSESVSYVEGGSDGDGSSGSGSGSSGGGRAASDLKNALSSFLSAVDKCNESKYRIDEIMHDPGMDYLYEATDTDATAVFPTSSIRGRVMSSNATKSNSHNLPVEAMSATLSTRTNPDATCVQVGNPFQNPAASSGIPGNAASMTNTTAIATASISRKSNVDRHQNPFSTMSTSNGVTQPSKSNSIYDPVLVNWHSEMPEASKPPHRAATSSKSTAASNVFTHVHTDNNTI